MYYYLYKTTNLVNNKFYVGVHQTNNLNDGYFGSGTRLKHAIAKYGKENFKVEILEFFDDRDSMYIKEALIVNSDLISSDLCYNMTLGGRGGTGVGILRGEAHPYFRIKRPEHAEKIRGRKHPSQVERARKVGLSNLGKRHSSIINKRKGRSGELNNQFGTTGTALGKKWITDGASNMLVMLTEFDLPHSWKLGRTNPKQKLRNV